MKAKAMAQRRAKPSDDELDLDTLVANAREASDFLKALSHEFAADDPLPARHRRKVGERDRTHAAPASARGLQQLARLRIDNLVDTRRDGKNIYYSLTRTEVREVIEALHRAFCAPGKAG